MTRNVCLTARSSPSPDRATGEMYCCLFLATPLLHDPVRLPDQSADTQEREHAQIKRILTQVLLIQKGHMLPEWHKREGLDSHEQGRCLDHIQSLRWWCKGCLLSYAIAASPLNMDLAALHLCSGLNGDHNLTARYA